MVRREWIPAFAGMTGYGGMTANAAGLTAKGGNEGLRIRNDAIYESSLDSKAST